MKFCKVVATGQVGEVRLHLDDSVVVHFQNGESQKLPLTAVKELELADEKDTSY